MSVLIFVLWKQPQDIDLLAWVILGLIIAVYYIIRDRKTQRDEKLMQEKNRSLFAYLMTYPNARVVSNEVDKIEIICQQDYQTQRFIISRDYKTINVTRHNKIEATETVRKWQFRTKPEQNDMIKRIQQDLAEENSHPKQTQPLIKQEPQKEAQPYSLTQDSPRTNPTGLFENSFTESQKLAIIDALIAIALSDGDMDPKEEVLLNKVGNIIKIRLNSKFWLEHERTNPRTINAELKSLYEGQKEWFLVATHKMIHTGNTGVDEKIRYAKTIYEEIGVDDYMYTNAIRKAQLMSDLFQ